MDEWGEICPGCSSMFTGTCNIARIIPGCSHNLCEKCILTDGTNTGQVKCGSPGCPTSIPWTNRLDQFLPNMFILGTVTYRQHCESQAPVPGNSVDILENVNDEIVGVTRSSESKVDKCEVMCGECEKSSADCLCQNCHSYLCSNCFDKIHKMAKSLLNHKSLPIVTDYNGQKMEQQVKLSNCTDHGKKIEYVAKGGKMGCAQCVIFGNLKGLDATTVVTYNKNIKKDLREKIEEGRSKIQRLKLVLSGLKSKRAVKEDKSSEDLTEEIKRHFSECHSHLQTLEHQLCQKLEKHQIELTAWQRDINVLIKSTASKIDEVTDVLQFSEEAVSNDALLDIFNFNEILSLLAIIDDEANEAVEQTRPDSCSLAIEPGFKHHLMSHVTLNKSDPSSVSHPTGASPPLASSTLLAPHYSGSSPSKMNSPVVSSTRMAFDSAGSSTPKMNSPIVSSTCMAFDSADSSSPKMNSPVVSSTCMDFVSAGSSPSPKIDLLVSGSEIIPLSSPEIYLTVPAEMNHQEKIIILQNEVLQTEVLQQETNRREKVSEQEVEQLEKVSEREVQQLDKVAQREVQQLENVLLTSSTTAGEQFYSLRTSVMEPSPAAPSAFTALDTTESSAFSEMASFVSESELPSSPLDPFPPTTSLTVSNEFYPPTTPVPEPSIVRRLDFTGSSPPPHMAPLLLESEISPSPLSPKVAQQLVKMSPLEIQQPQVSRQHLSPDISTASSPFSLEHPIPSAQTVWISYQDGNNSTRCVDIDELSPQRTWMERQERLFPEDEKISPSKKEKHQKSGGGDSGVLSKSWKKSTKVNVRRNLIEKNLHQSEITKVTEGESRQSSPPDWNSVFKKSIQKIKAQKQAPNLKRIYEQITRTHRYLKPISYDIVGKKLDEAVKKGVLERIVKDEKVTFRVTRRPRFKVARKLLSTPSASPLDDLNGVGLDKNNFLAMLGLQEKVNV